MRPEAFTVASLLDSQALRPSAPRGLVVPQGEGNALVPSSNSSNRGHCLLQSETRRSITTCTPADVADRNGLVISPRSALRMGADLGQTMGNHGISGSRSGVMEGRLERVSACGWRARLGPGTGRGDEPARPGCTITWEPKAGRQNRRSGWITAPESNSTLSVPATKRSLSAARQAAGLRERRCRRDLARVMPAVLGKVPRKRINTRIEQERTLASP